MVEIPQPSISLRAFACPHCGAHSDQRWYELKARSMQRDERVPYVPTPADVEMTRREAEGSRGDEEERKGLQQLAAWAEKMVIGEPFLHSERYINAEVALENVFASVCYTCRQVALWVHDRMIYPASKSGEAPNADMPEDIARDYEEARCILDLSPRGAAALLRLAIQKLCVHLGEPGENINADIASLVGKGLDQMTAEALDAVRVIGNESVHPGQMDLRDDRSTAAELFYAVNFIVDQMITKKRKLKEIYDKLPPDKRAAIDQRNAKARAAQQEEQGTASVLGGTRPASRPANPAK